MHSPQILIPISDILIILIDSYHHAEVPDRELSSNSSETANDVILRRTQSFENDQK